jgi:hypothetical protein
MREGDIFFFYLFTAVKSDEGSIFSSFLFFEKYLLVPIGTSFGEGPYYVPR